MSPRIIRYPLSEFGTIRDMSEHWLTALALPNIASHCLMMPGKLFIFFLPQHAQVGGVCSYVRGEAGGIPQ